MWKGDPEQGLQEVTASVTLNLRLYDKKSEQKDIKHKHAACLVLFKEAFQFGGHIRRSLCNATARRKHPKSTCCLVSPFVCRMFMSSCWKVTEDRPRATGVCDCVCAHRRACVCVCERLVSLPLFSDGGLC